MKTKKLLVFGFGLLISLATLLFVTDGQAFAATKTWDGGGGDDNFNTAANWDGDSVPSNGDDLVFDVSVITGGDVTGNKWVLTNNISGLIVTSITFTGTSGSNYTYQLDGNAITVNSAITDNKNNWINLSLILGGNVTLAQSGNSGTTIGNSSTTLDTNGNTLTINGNGATCGLLMGAALSGSGSIAVALSAGGVNFETPANNFTGAISGTAGVLSVNDSAAFGSTSGVTISGATTLGLALDGANRTYTFPITLSGSGYGPYGAVLHANKGIRTIGCGGGGSNDTKYTATLSGAVTLNSNIVYAGYDVNTNVTGTYTSNGHSITVKSGTDGTITTPDGTSSAPAETFTINAGDNQPSQDISISANQTYIINGVRGWVGIYDNGVLKGTGVIGGLSIWDSGRVSPGLSPGCLTVNGNFSMNGIGDSGFFDAELGGTTVCSGYDQLIVNGTVRLGDDLNGAHGVLNTSIYGDFKPQVGNTFMIIDNDGDDAVVGTFKDLPEGATFEVGGVVFRISYVGGDGNDVVLTVLSVPAAPDTGFGLLVSNPLATLGVTSTLAGAIYLLSRKQGLLFKK